MKADVPVFGPCIVGGPFFLKEVTFHNPPPPKHGGWCHRYNPLSRKLLYPPLNGGGSAAANMAGVLPHHLVMDCFCGVLEPEGGSVVFFPCQIATEFSCN